MIAMLSIQFLMLYNGYSGLTLLLWEGSKQGCSSPPKLFFLALLAHANANQSTGSWNAGWPVVFCMVHTLCTCHKMSYSDPLSPFELYYTIVWLGFFSKRASGRLLVKDT